MSYTYRNKKTREVINTTNKVTGKNWEPVEEKIPQQPPTDDFPEDPPVVDDIPEEETTAEDVPEVPAEKPKTTRRGKK